MWVITRSYLSSLIKQFCIIIVCLFPKLSNIVCFLNTISGLFDDIDDPPVRYGFIVIC